MTTPNNKAKRTQAMATQTHTVTTTEYVVPDTDALVARLQTIRAELNNRLVDREREITALLVGLLSGRHVILTGLRGTGKTTLVDALVEHLAGATYFGTALHPFKKPDDLFGSIDVPAMQAGEYQLRLNRMANANVTFLDETSRGSQATLESLFDVLEKRRIENAGSYHRVPLWLCIGAANSAFDPDRLGPLRDRFPICVEVKYVRPDQMLTLADRYLDGGLELAAPTTLSPDEVQILRDVCKTVTVPTPIRETMKAIVQTVRPLGPMTSDRRWLNGFDVLKAHALLHGRLTVELVDLPVLSMVLGDFEDEQVHIDTALAEYSKPFGQLKVAAAEASQVMATLNTTTGDAAAVMAGLLRLRELAAAGRAAADKVGLASVKAAAAALVETQARLVGEAEALLLALL